MTIVRENQIRPSDLGQVPNIPWSWDQSFDLYIDWTSDAGEYAHWQYTAEDFDWQCINAESQLQSDQATAMTGIRVQLDSPPSIYNKENIRLGGRGLRHHPHHREDTLDLLISKPKRQKRA